MKLLSAYEDFSLRTLTSFSNVLGKLEFIAKLQSSPGEYDHWGMQYTHGVEAASAAIARAHQELTLELLSTPISDLHREFAGGSDRRIDPHGWEPSSWGGGCTEHLDYVLHTLTLLNQAYAPSIHQAA